MVSASRIIASKLENSILSAAFGSGVAHRRVLDHAERAWELERGRCATWPSFDDFVETSFRDLREPDEVPQGLPPAAIPFFAWAPFVFDAYVFEADSISWWHILDMSTRDPKLVVRSEIFEAYSRHSAIRKENVRKGVDPRPLWFVCRDGGLGVPLVGKLPSLWHEDKSFLRLDGKPRKTMKLKISWLGYQLWNTQIRPESKKGDSSVKRLATLVTKQVRTFMDEHDASRTVSNVDGERAYTIGTQPGQVSAKDVLVLGIVIVSGGAAMPILQLRDGLDLAS